MKFSDNFKRNWWYASLVTVGSLLFFRIESIIAGNATDFDIGLLVVATALALTPLFSEFTFMGLTLKQQIEETKQEIEAAKSELKYEIKDLQFSIRNDLNNLVAVSNNAQQIMYNNPPPDSYLEPLAQQIINAMQPNLSPEDTSESPEVILEHRIPVPVEFAFKGRYLLETEIRRIWEQVYGRPSPRTGMMLLLQELANSQVVSNQLLQSVQQVNSVINPVVHGEDFTTEQIEFLENTIPPLLVALNKI